MGVLGVVLVYKSGLRILIRAPKVPFLAARKWLKLAKMTRFKSFWGYQKWHFGCPNQNSKSTYIDQNHPQNPQKDTLGTQIRPRKVIFSHFFYFFHFPIEIPIVVEKNYGQRKEWSYNENKKCSKICEQNGTT